MKKRDVFFRLLRAGLWGEGVNAIELPSANYHSLMSMAEKQTVTGIIGQTFMDNGIKLQKLDAIDVFAQTQTIRQRNKELNEAVANLAGLLNSRHIRYVVVKGQVLAHYYPHPDLRMSGDIDILVHPKDMQAMGEALKGEWGIDLPPITKKRHVEVDYCGTDLEVHIRLLDLPTRSQFRYWNELYAGCLEHVDTVQLNEVPVATLQPTLNLLFVFMHMYNHFMMLGCGLRQMMDVMLLLHGESQRIDKKLLKESLKRLNVYDAFCAFGFIMIDKLGLPQEEFPYEVEDKHRRYEKRILDEVFLRGNHGKYSRKVYRAGWGRNFETACIFGKHSLKFFWLSPRNAMLYPKYLWNLLCNGLFSRFFKD